MRLAIVGGRDFDDYDVLVTWADSIFYMQDTDSKIVVSGGARGADSLARRYAGEHIAEYLEFPADWETHGKAAGFIRNQQIVDACDMVLAFWDGKSKGTQDTITKAKKAKKSTFIVYFTPQPKKASRPMKGL